MSDYAAFIIMTDQKYSSKFADIIINLPNVAQAIEHNFWSTYDGGQTIAYVTRWITCTSTGISISKSTFTYWSVKTQPTTTGAETDRSADIRPRKIIGILK